MVKYITNLREDELEELTVKSNDEIRRNIYKDDVANYLKDNSWKFCEPDLYRHEKLKGLSIQLQTPTVKQHISKKSIKQIADYYGKTAREILIEITSFKRSS